MLSSSGAALQDHACILLLLFVSVTEELCAPTQGPCCWVQQAEQLQTSKQDRSQCCLPLQSASGAMCRHDQKLPDAVPDISTPEERCAYLRAAGHVALSKAGVRLNLKHLYVAQEQAITELLKLALPLAAAAAPSSQVWAP